MDDSQTRAITVALEHLGYEMVPTDVLITDLVPDIPAAEVLEIGDSVDSFNGTEIVRSTDLTDLLEVGAGRCRRCRGHPGRKPADARWSSPGGTIPRAGP